MSPQLKGANIKAWSFIGNNLALIDAPIDDQLLNIKEVSYLYNMLADKRTVLIPSQTIDKNVLTGVTSKTDVEYDSFYNVSKQTDITLGSGSSFTNTNENEYYNDTSFNIIGRLTYKKESITAYNDHFSTQTDYIYNGNDLVSTETSYQDSGKSKIEYKYDVFGNVIQVTDYGNYVTENTTPRIIKSKYDGSGRFVSEKTDIDNFTETLYYNDSGQVVKQVDKFGVITKSFYDNWGKMVRTEVENTSTTPIVTIYRYNRNASGTNIVTSNLQTLEYSIQYFDIQGRNIKNTIKGFSDNQYVSTSIEYNFLGSKIRESQPYFGNSPSLWTTYEYDNLLRPIKITNPTGLIATNTYNGLEATSVEGVRSKKVIKDALDNTIQIIDNGTELIEHTYFAHGGLKSTKYENHIIETKYDVFGRKIYFLDPTVSAIPYTYAYNNFNEIIEENTPETTTQFTYDSSGRVLKKRTTGKSNLEVNYTYDPALKNLLIKEEGTNEGKPYTNTLNYDTFYRVVGKTNVTPYFSFNEAVTYDAIGRTENTTSKILKDGQVLQNVTLNHQYNLYNGDLQLVKDVSNGIVGKTIWEVSQKSERGEALTQKLGEVITLENTFDSYGNLTNIRHRNGTQWLANKEYYYQVDRGLLIKRKDTHFNWEENFTYDTFDRLLTWSSPLGINSNTYIADGRINENSQVGQYSYNTTAKYKKESIQLNNNGLNHYNTRTNQTIVYDGFKRPLNITEENRGSVDFEYGINSSRIKAVKNNLITNTTITKYYAPNGSIEVVVDAQQNAKIVNYLGSPYETPYIYVTEINLDSKVKTNESFYYLGRDFQGSITEIFESNGTSTIERRLFDPWGNITKLEDNIGGNYIEGENAFLAFLDRGYTGHEHFTEVGIIHMNGRIYDPILKQFLSPDNFIQDPSNSQNYNRYGYAWNNPLKYTDPSGEIITIASVATAAIISAAVSAGSYVAINLINGQNVTLDGFLKASLSGAISGAISLGVGEAATAIFSYLTLTVKVSTQTAKLVTGISQVAMHGITQGSITGISGGKFIDGFMAGAISSGLSSLGDFASVAISGKDESVLNILFTTATTGLYAKLTNGNVWEAASIAFAVSAMNHSKHKLKNPENGYDRYGNKINDNGGDTTDYMYDDKGNIISSTYVQFKGAIPSSGELRGYGFKGFRMASGNSPQDNTIFEMFVGGSIARGFKFLRNSEGAINGFSISSGTKYGARPRLDYHKLVNPSKKMNSFPEAVKNKRLLHYHRGKGNSLHRHRPWEKGWNDKGFLDRF